MSRNEKRSVRVRYYDDAHDQKRRDAVDELFASIPGRFERHETIKRVLHWMSLMETEQLVELLDDIFSKTEAPE